MTTPRKRDWTAHDAAIPFKCPKLARANGTNPMGRRPHSTLDSQLRQAANDNGRQVEE